MQQRRFCVVNIPTAAKVGLRTGLGTSGPELARGSAQSQATEPREAKTSLGFFTQKDHDKTVPSSSLGHYSWSPGQRVENNVVSTSQKIFKKQIELQGRLGVSVN